MRDRTNKLEYAKGHQVNYKSRPRRNQSMLATVLTASLATASIAAVPVMGVTAVVAEAAVSRDVSFTKSLRDGVDVFTQDDGKSIGGNTFTLTTGNAGGLSYKFPDGEYTIEVGDKTYKADGVASVVKMPSGVANAVVELTLRNGESIPATTKILHITSKLKGEGGEAGQGLPRGKYLGFLESNKRPR